MTKKKETHSDCRFKHPHYNLQTKQLDHHCVADGWDDDKVKTVTQEMCANCTCYKSRYIQYPLTINSIDTKPIDTNFGLGHDVGELCEIQPCGDEYQQKSYLGIYLGDLPISIHTTFNEETGILTTSPLTNPAVYVPELKKIIYGCESWWRTIESIDDFKGISQDDIANTWYVKLLKELNVDNSVDNVDNKISVQKIEPDEYVLQTLNNTSIIKTGDALSELHYTNNRQFHITCDMTVLDITKRQISVQTDDDEIFDIKITWIDEIIKKNK